MKLRLLWERDVLLVTNRSILFLNQENCNFCIFVSLYVAIRSLFRSYMIGEEIEMSLMRLF